jgi:pectinesterase
MDLAPKRLLAAAALALLMAASTTPKHSLYVVGDSTSCLYASTEAPRTGWGQVLQDYFKPESVAVVDKALSGRSSKSFYVEGAWAPVKALLQKGDYVIIAFAHNDEKTDDTARGTLPGSTFEQYLSIYIDDAKAAGAIPLLVTPIERNGWTNSTTVKASHGAYPQAIRDLAAKKGIGVVDLTALTTARYQQLGQDTTTNKLFMNLAAGVWPNYPTGNTDNTHLQVRGANEVAKLLTADIVKQKLTTLSGWVVGGTTGLARSPEALRPDAVGGTTRFDALGRARRSTSGLPAGAYWSREMDGTGAIRPALEP